jgi:hypothetical protein
MLVSFFCINSRNLSQKRHFFSKNISKIITLVPGVVPELVPALKNVGQILKVSGETRTRDPRLSGGFSGLQPVQRNEEESGQGHAGDYEHEAPARRPQLSRAKWSRFYESVRASIYTSCLTVCVLVCGHMTFWCHQIQ